MSSAFVSANVSQRNGMEGTKQSKNEKIQKDKQINESKKKEHNKRKEIQMNKRKRNEHIEENNTRRSNEK